jgi:hypothetical protein
VADRVDRRFGSAAHPQSRATRTSVDRSERPRRRYLQPISCALSPNRARTELARDAGVRQFLDIGTGLLTEANKHQVAQRIASDSRVVYVDKDPLVLAHTAVVVAIRRRSRYADKHSWLAAISSPVLRPARHWKWRSARAGCEALPRRFRYSGLATLRSGSACHRMTWGAAVIGGNWRLGRSRDWQVRSTSLRHCGRPRVSCPSTRSFS